MDSHKSEANPYSSYHILTILKSGIDIDKCSHYIDQNILTFRFFPHTVGLVGLVILFRGVRLSSKFTKVSQIPQSFIRKNVQLRGKIKQVNLDGTLEVEHLPILRMPWHRLYQSPFVNVRLAYVSPSISGTYWMRLNVIENPIKFRLIDRNIEKSQIIALVKTPIAAKGTLNETLVQNGLAKVQSPENEYLTKTKAKLISSLESCQMKAKKKGLGMWSDPHGQQSWYDLSIRNVSKIFSNLTNK